MQAALIWIVVVIGPDFIIEARWSPLQFTDRSQCDQWLSETTQRGSVRVRSDLRVECQPINAGIDVIEE
jgi:hypothetical protein